MHYYKKNIGDYAKKAGRLSMLEHGAYTLLIDACYDRERFPTKEEAIDWCWARTEEEVAAVKFVLRKFFTLEDERLVQKRIQEELDKYHASAKRNKEIALEREKKRKEKRERSSTKRERSVNEAPPNQEPLTINQEPRTSNNNVVELGNSTSEFQQVFEFWQQTMNHPRAKLDDKRKRLIVKAIKQYGFEEAKQAILGCKFSAWHMGKNPEGTKHDGIELILRNAEKIERFLGYYRNPPESESDRRKRELDEWANSDEVIDGEAVGGDS